MQRVIQRPLDVPQLIRRWSVAVRIGVARSSCTAASEDATVAVADQ